MLPSTVSPLPYLHLVSALVYVGGMVFTGGLLIPAARRLQEGRGTLAVIGQVVKILHPILLACLGLLIMTGAVMLTNLKVTLGDRYFGRVFSTLGPKLLVVFVLALLNSYQFFGLGLRVTRSLAEEPVGPVGMPLERIGAMLPLVARLQWCAWIGAVLGGAVVYLGLVMERGW